MKSLKKISKVALAATLLTGLFAGSALASKNPANENSHRVETVAHRGATGYAPENTMAAFKKAFEMKADYFELDVQMSKDGELVLIHDTTVDRTTDGTGKVGELTFEELRSLDAGSFFSSEFAGEKIPTLGEALDTFRGKIGILIEIKSPELYPGIEQKVADELIERNMHKPQNGKIIIQSFNHDSVKQFHEILPSVPVGVLISNSNDGISDEQLEQFASYADYVNPNMAMVNESLVNRIHALGMEIMPWTVRSPEQVAPLLEAGVDGIITDYPDYVPRNK